MGKAHSTQSGESNRRRTTAGDVQLRNKPTNSTVRPRSLPVETEVANRVSMVTTATTDNNSQAHRNNIATLSSQQQQQDRNNNKPSDDVTSINSNVTSPPKDASVDSPRKVHKHSSDTVDAFGRLLDQVVLIWPDLSPLRSIDPSTLDGATLNTIRETLRRLIEQYTRIRALQDESRAKAVTVQQVEQKSAATESQLTTKTKEIEQLTATISSLKAELESRAREATRKLELPAADYELDTTVHSPSTGSYRSAAAVADDTRVTAQLQKTIEQLQQDNSQLRQRLKLQDKDSRSKRSSQQIVQLVEKYERLEEEAIGKLFTTVKNACPLSVTDERRSKFICAVMETAHAMSIATRVRFNDVIIHLLLDPTQLSADVTAPELTSVMTGDGKPLTNGGHVTSYASLSNRRSKSNGRRSQSLDERSHWLVEQFDAFINHNSDVIDLTPLVESVMETLKRSYPDCCQPSLIGHTSSSFSQFVASCCSVAWQLVTSDPPFYVATTTDGSQGRFSPQLHSTLMQEAVPMASIDHYLWPVLFDKCNGHVLYRGRVVLNLPS